MKRFFRMAFLAVVLLMPDSQCYLWAKPIPATTAVKRPVRREKPKTPAHVYAIAGSVVAVSAFGVLAAVYFARKKNPG